LIGSIRANLVIWLVGGLVIGWIAALAGTYLLTRVQVGEMFDEELRQVALAVHLREDWIREGRVRIARPGFFLSVRAYDRAGRVYFETALPTLPLDLPHTFEEGFRAIDTSQGRWRIYTHLSEEGVLQVGQPVATRDALARDVSARAVVPLFVLIPFLALLVGWILKRALRPLDETSARVSDRDATRLDPLPLEGVPSELLPLVQQINALLGRLSLALDADRRFLADAAHELRSPISALALQVQLARRAKDPATRERALEELSLGVDRARRLVHQLLDFARFEPSVVLGPPQTVDLAEIAREVVGLHASRADAKGVDLGAEAPGPAPVLGDREELRSLIENLVDNALRYAPPETAVTVSVKTHGDACALSVVDAGPGIPPEERSRVFERFHRVPGDATVGTGLGLAIAKAIVERHRGSILLRAAMDGIDAPGLAVHVVVPKAPAAPHGAASPARPLAQDVDARLGPARG
jgi:two-component system, OmpR family, sensor kinase